ncbi:MAG: methyltransferase domain-containing protein [bacterium]|nr:methyltransferase domain-containing protein [bacterium]
MGDNKKKILRAYEADPLLEQMERDWWDKNADIGNKAWEMEDSLSWKVRKRYLKQARKFLKGDKESVTVLELGCGSGWLGQFLAGPGFEVIGSDFSKTQIAAAKKNAREKQLDKYCRYYVEQNGAVDCLLTHTGENLEKIDGVLLHAFLHHLDGKELEELFRTLRANLEPGTKIWIYEPAFFKTRKHHEGKRSPYVNTLMNITSRLLSLLHKVYDRFHLLDSQLAEALRTLFRQAEENQWYLTPKEVPMEIDEFTFFLEEEKIRVKRQYWATIFLITRLVKTNCLKNPLIKKIVTYLLVPLLTYTDHLITKEEQFLQYKMTAPMHAFCIWECVLT